MSIAKDLARVHKYMDMSIRLKKSPAYQRADVGQRWELVARFTKWFMRNHKRG